MALNVMGKGGSVQGTGLRRSLRTRPPPLRCASGGQGQGAAAARHGEPVAGAKPQQALDGGVLPGVQPLLDPVGAVHPGPVPAVRGAPGTGLPPQEIDGMGAWGRPVRRSGRAQSKDTDAAGSFARPPPSTHTHSQSLNGFAKLNPPPSPGCQYLDEWGYMVVGLAAALPCFLLPPLLPNKVGGDANGRPAGRGGATISARVSDSSR